MFYLITCSSFESVKFKAIIGIAKNKNGIMELLFNYHKYHFSLCPKNNFENSHFDIDILVISEKDYNYLSKKINVKCEEIEDYHKKISFVP